MTRKPLLLWTSMTRGRLQLKPMAPAMQAAIVAVSAVSGSWAVAQDATPRTAAPSGLGLFLPEATAWRAATELAGDARALLAVEAARAPADGRRAVRLDISLVQRDGQPLTSATRVQLHASLGRLSVEPPLASEPVMPALDISAPGPALRGSDSLDLVIEGGQAIVWLQAPATPGQAQLQLRSGAVRVDGSVDFVPELRPLMAIGLIEGVIRLGRIERDSQAALLRETGFDDELRRWNRSSADGEHVLAGRAAFYARGLIKGEYLLTASADSDKDTRTRLFRDIDPNQYYPVYGDASTREFDAQSRGRLYVRIDKDRSYALLGDITTGGNEAALRLSTYQRSLSGARWQVEQGALKGHVYLSHGRQQLRVDEMPGRGLSGPYAVGQPDALVNSERVEILVRDRTQAARVIQLRTMTRHVDYDFEPFTGRLVFRQPVPSVDEQLNPVSIRVSYEVQGDGPRFWIGGGEANLQVNDQLRVGVALASDGNDLAPYRLAGIHATYQPGPHTTLMAELAGSRGTSLALAGSATLPPAGALPARSGEAARVELRHRDDGLRLRAHAARAEAGFQNSQGGLLPGRQEMGLQAKRRLGEDWGLVLGLARTEDRSGTASDGARRATAEAGVEWRPTPALKLDIGMHQVRERQVAGFGGALNASDAISANASVPGLGSSASSSFGFGGSGLLAPPVLPAAAGGSATAPVDRGYDSLRLRLTGEWTPRLRLSVEHERAEDGRQRSAAGADYQLDGRSRVYARHEFANSLTGPDGLASDGRRSQVSAVGIDTRLAGDTQLYSELRRAGSGQAADGLSAVGLRHQWVLGEGLSVSGAFERQDSRNSTTGAQQATAVALGAEFQGHPLLRAGGKLEWRTSSVQDSSLVSLGIDRRLADDWTALLRVLQMQSQGRGSAAGNDDSQSRLQLGLAWRDTRRNRLHTLARIELREEDRLRDAAAGMPGTEELQRSTVLSLHANWQPEPTWTHAAQVGWKSVNERSAVGGVGRPASWQGALLSWRTRHDLGERWDVSVHASWQQGEGARVGGLGAEVGFRLVDDLWLSAGATAGHYSDADMFAAGTRWRGAHLRLRFKFDETLLGRRP